ncbi:MAG: glycoside hydrolase family 92 protein, partial [Pyrinomonadaceae bacterium]
MKKIIAIAVLLSFHVTSFAQSPTNYVKHVDPLIGTQKMGHTFPGATVPFGSVQLSPDTDQQPHNVGGKYNKDAYKYCAGYQYDDKEIVGFSHTHFSGTGHSDLGDFLV